VSIIYRLLLSMIILTSCSLSNIYMGDCALTFRLVSSGFEGRTCKPGFQANLDTDDYECFTKGDASYWVSRKVALGSDDIRNLRLVISVFDVSTGGLKDREFSPEKDTPIFNDPANRGLCIILSLSKIGQIKFENITKNNVGGRLALMLDKSLILVLPIEETITGGDIKICGFSLDEARRIEKALVASSRKR